MNFDNNVYNANKRDNVSLILRLINMEGRISRIQLSRLTGLTKTTITNIINKLLSHNLVVEHGHQPNTSVGRKPVLISINRDAYNIIGIYISRDYSIIARTDLFGNIRARRHFEFKLGDSIDSVLSRIIKLTKDLISINSDNILGIGIGSIGPIDVKKGVILEPPNFRNWKGIPIVSILKEQFACPIFIDNDMNGCALAERF
ncbi:MAG TPA: ROK family transcriptional regulator [Clostridiales bacterium]|nr:ROK family transcriptional regulator [Clostridiales bacterium]